MLLKSGKSRCLVIRKGKTTDRFKLIIQGEEIPSLISDLVRCLCKLFNSSLSDKNSQDRMSHYFKEGLRRIGKYVLPGEVQSLYQQGLLPRYSKLQLPLGSLLEEYKVSKARLLQTLRDSADEGISNACIGMRTGRKCSSSQAVDQTESNLRHNDIVGTTHIEREERDVRQQQTRWDKAYTAERRSMVQIEIRKEDEELMSARAVHMSLHGGLTMWNLPERETYLARAVEI